jgi:hypothetical protein
VRILLADKDPKDTRKLAEIVDQLMLPHQPANYVATDRHTSGAALGTVGHGSCSCRSSWEAGLEAEQEEKAAANAQLVARR